MQSRNLAARAGRWSAQHRKTAILGWIAFVVLATVARRQGRPEQHRRVGPGQRRVQARRHDRRGRRLPRAGRRAGARPGQGPSADPQVDRRRQGRRAPPRSDPGHHRDREPARPAQPRQHGLQGRPLGRRELHDAGHRRARRAARSSKPLAAVAAAQKAHPGVRVEQFGDASATKEIAAQDAKDGKKSRAHLLRPDADHPAGRVRRARRRRPPAACSAPPPSRPRSACSGRSASSTRSRPTSPSSS